MLTGGQHSTLLLLTAAFRWLLCAPGFAALAPASALEATLPMAGLCLSMHATVCASLRVSRVLVKMSACIPNLIARAALLHRPPSSLNGADINMNTPYGSRTSSWGVTESSVLQCGASGVWYGNGAGAGVAAVHRYLLPLMLMLLQ